MITVIFNNHPVNVQKNYLLSTFLTEQQYDQRYYAVVVNRNFIPRHLHPETILQEGDVIEIISPMQGG